MFSEPILALDTSEGASACLLLPEGQVFTAAMSTPRAHSRELLPMLKGLLDKPGLNWSDIGTFAVSIGPGSFTGLRVACATIAGLNASLERPVYGLCSLSITAKQAAYDGALWSIEDARSQLVYAACFENGKVIEAAQCISWDAFLAKDPMPYVSNSAVPVPLEGWQLLPIKISREQALVEAVQSIEPDAEHALWQEPVYLQVSQAEKNLL